MKGTIDRPWMEEGKPFRSCGPGRGSQGCTRLFAGRFLEGETPFANSYVKELIELEIALGSFARILLSFAKSPGLCFLLFCFVRGFLFCFVL